PPRARMAPSITCPSSFFQGFRVHVPARLVFAALEKLDGHVMEGAILARGGRGLIRGLGFPCGQGCTPQGVEAAAQAFALRRHYVLPLFTLSGIFFVSPDNFTGQPQVGNGSPGAAVIDIYRLAIARSLRKPHVAGDGGSVNLVAKMFVQL